MPEKTSVATARLLAEVWWLKQCGPVSVDHFARHFHRTKRQIMRDINAIGQARDSMPGESFELDWYQLERGIVAVWGMNDLIQKPALTTNEALQILFGLRVMAPLLDEAGRQQATTLILTLAPLVEGFDAFRFVFIDVHDFAPGITVAEEAIAQRRQLVFTYQDRHGQVSHRRVDPERLDHRMDGWYLNAWCYVAGGQRTFRLSAMSEVTVGDQQAVGHPDTEPTIPDVFDFTVTSAARWLVDDRIAELVEDQGHTIQVRLPVWDPQWVVGLLIELGDSVTQLPTKWEQARRARAHQIRDVWEQVDRV